MKSTLVYSYVALIALLAIEIVVGKGKNEFIIITDSSNNIASSVASPQVSPRLKYRLASSIASPQVLPHLSNTSPQVSPRLKYHLASSIASSQVSPRLKYRLISSKLSITSPQVSSHLKYHLTKVSPHLSIASPQYRLTSVSQDGP